MGKKLAEFVCVVIDAGNQIPGAIGIEKGYRQFLQFGEYTGPQIEQHPLAQSTHKAGLGITGKQAEAVQGEQYQGVIQHALKLAGGNIGIYDMGNQQRSNQVDQRIEHCGNGREHQN